MNGPVLSRVFRAYPLETGAFSLLAVALLAWGLLAQPAQALSGILTAAFFTLTVALGAAILLAISGVSGARWHRPVAPAASALAGTYVIPAIAVGATLAAAVPVLYPWARGGAAGSVWLNPPAFLARAAIVLLAWAGAIALLRARPGARSSIAFLLVLAPTLSVASWDWLMSLQASWTSTMFAVTTFAGSFVAGIAAVAAVAILLDARGLLPAPLAASTRHDLGKLLFGFSMFWAYVWFCQYLLIWYSNLPEETPYYATRSHGGWSALFWLVPVLSFAAPFGALLTARAKKRPALLAEVCLVVLVGRWLDVWVTVAPPAGPVPAFPTYAVAATFLLLVAGAFAFDRALAARPAPVEVPAAA